MIRRLLIGLLALVAWGNLTAASAQQEVTLTEETVLKLIPDVDRVDVRKTPGKFRGIRVYALDGTAVDISKIDIKYADGSTFTEDRGRLIRLDSVDVRTRVMGPDGGNGPEKFIDEIVLYYKTAKENPGRARIRVTGITSRRGAQAIRDGAQPVSAAPATGVIPGTPTAPKPNEAKPGTAGAGGDVLFGVQYVGFGVDRDVIKIGRELGQFGRLRLRVLDNDIFINEMRVIYSNGEPDVLAVAANVPANTRTRWFDLKGDRFINEIQLTYRSRPGFRGQARLEAYGEYSENWYGPSSGPGSPKGAAFSHSKNRGWLYLGGQQPLFFSVKKGLGFENDTISVARNWGFNRLRLDVKDRAITLNRLTINYADGTTDTVPVGSKVDAGSSFGPIQLKQKPVRDIVVSYRSRLLDAQAKGKSYAFVEFWAQ